LEEIKSFTEDNIERGGFPLKRIGNLIKEARVSRDQSIEELASVLKIGVHQLKAIEDGNEEQLPEEVFVKAMVRRISQKLKLDTKFIMAEFETESEEVRKKEIVEKVSEKTQKSKKDKKLKPVGVVISILISGFLGLVASSLIFNLFWESFQNKTPKQEFIKKTK
tara:strand:+ start:59 stop:553 length:495 start_codon:yes stop_codon:yes gene_type:complete